MSAAPSNGIRLPLMFVLVWLGFFAGWSLVIIPLTISGASFQLAYLGYAGGGLGAVLGWRASASLLPAFQHNSVAVPEPWARKDWIFVGFGVCGGLAAAAAFVKTQDARPLWCVLAIICVAGLVKRRMQPETAPPQRSPDAPPQVVGVLLLSIVIVGLYLLLLRPDADDAFYLNLPIGLKTAAHGMMVYDTMYGVADWPLLGSNYRVETLPALVATVSALTGLSVISVAHLVLPVIWCLAYAAMLVVAGYALFGSRWWVFAGLAVALGMVLSGTLQGWGVHGIFRLFHGKAPMMIVVFPLLWLTVLRLDQIGFTRSLVILAGLELIAVGLTANAVYLAPLALGLLLVGRVLSGGSWTYLLLLASSFPALAAGLWLLLFDTPVTNQRFADLDHTLALWAMAPNTATVGLVTVVFVMVALAAWVTKAGRFASAYMLAALVFLINPLLWPFYDTYVTGALNFRLWWAVPVPIMAAAMIAFALQHRAHLWSVAALAGIAALVVVWPSSILNTAHSQIRLSFWKVPAPEFAIARQAQELAQDGMRILAPEEVSAWLTVIEPRATPVFVRALYLDQSAPLLDPDLLTGRKALADWIDGRSVLPLPDLTRYLADMCVDIIVLPAGTNLNLVAEQVAQAGGYRFFRFAGGASRSNATVCVP